ncbi:MAG: MXAN_6521/LA_1396 family lipoprotein [Leptospiraceae bacterium]|nr:MXAN_6521/LA_1396 family lipoprotein [Leptospiraceae bacterium]MCP5513825.1 MXAN_6521/LA_1396 family lipoprotein [Leptospiraceae bacterium]
MGKTTNYLNSKLRFIFTLLFLIQCSTIRTMERSPDLEKDLKTLKRVYVLVNPDNPVTIMENQTFQAIFQSLISHHSEFILYPTPEGLKPGCSGFTDKNIEGYFYLSYKQKIDGDKIYLDIKSELKKCPGDSNIWMVEAEDSYSLTSKENESLRRMYVEKFGMGVESRVNPYYYLSKNILEKVVSPELTEDEKDEKVIAGSN